MKNKVIIFLVMLLVLSSTMFSIAEEKRIYDYEDFVEAIKEKYNINFKSPKSNFEVIVNEGKSDMQIFKSEPKLPPYDETQGSVLDKIPITGVVKPGDTLKLIDKSVPGEDGIGNKNKIFMWDWQIHSYFSGGYMKSSVAKRITQNVTINVPSNKGNAYREGYIFIFLNAADDYSNEKLLDFINHTQYGNFKSGDIKTMKVNPNITIKGWPFTVMKLKVENRKSDMILRKLELVDPETEKIVESFERKTDNLDPFNTGKQKLVRTNTKPHEASVLKKNKKYKVRAEYQFVSFMEGGFDISNPNSMTSKQRNLSTKITSNKLDRMYSYDEKWNQDGVFDDTGVETSINKPSVELKNLETAFFEWDFEVPKNAKKHIKIAAKIPEIFANKEVDTDIQSSWGAIFARLEATDIGMTEPVELLKNGKPVKFIEPNKLYTVAFNVKHCFGDKAVGLDSKTNPKVRARIQIKDGKGREILEQNIEANSILYPNQTIRMPMSEPFSADTRKITACATIDPIHKALGFNDSLLNDTICSSFMSAKNYAVKNLKAVPMSVHFAKDKTSLKQPVTLNFDITDESSNAGETTPSNPIVVVKHGNTKIWEGTISITPGKTVRQTMTFDRTLKVGENSFSVEVNPDRIIEEYIPGVDNPYTDNKKTTSVLGVKYEKCEECFTKKIRNRNEWQERWEWAERRGSIRTSTYLRCFKYRRKKGTRCVKRNDDGSCAKKEEYYYKSCVDRRPVSYEYCNITYRNNWSEVRDYYENFKIKNIYFRSKWSKDNHGGWIDIKNNGVGKIKAGHGFELKIVTNYKTNRHILPSPGPYRGNRYSGDKYGRYSGGYCDTITRYPGLTPIDSPNHIYMIMPYSDDYGEKVCYILNPTGSTVWNNNDKTFELPLRKSFGIKNERKIYINEDARPQKQKIYVYTPRPDRNDRFWGYYPENPVWSDKDYLHDCNSFYIEILPQDDGKSHIIQ